MESVAMLKQFIEQLQQFSPPPPQSLHQQQQYRCCFLSLNDSSIEDGYHNLVMKSRKSRTFMLAGPYYMPPPTKRSRKERNRGKLARTARSMETMDEQIWKQFPNDLFEVVIARLPTATFFQFRSVCKKWNSLMNSHSFSQQCSRVEKTQPWFYTITHESESTGAMYDPSSKKWHHPLSPSFPTKLTVLPVASEGGLVCFVDIGHRYFYVCNPVTRSFKELPARSVKVWSRIAVGMILDRSPTRAGYKIMWLGSDGEYEIYDSGKNAWTRPGSIPPSIKLPLSLNFRSQAVLSDNSLHFMRSEPEGIVSYDMITGIWKQYIIPAPMHLTDHVLAECEGKIMLVGLLTKNAATCVCIWELQKMMLLWKEVDRMPNILCLEFYGKHIRMTCLGNKSLLMLSLRSSQMNRLVTYDFKSKEWLKVPRCVLPGGKKQQWIACGTAFHPCPTAVV